MLKRVKTVSAQEPKQMRDEEVVNYLSLALNYKKDVSSIVRALKEFMHKYESKMRGLMPIYHLYFKMLANKEELLP